MTCSFSILKVAIAFLTKADKEFANTVNIAVRLVFLVGF
jgi:hypothetical protein